jgi:hypothetical protein
MPQNGGQDLLQRRGRLLDALRQAIIVGAVI